MKKAVLLSLCISIIWAMDDEFCLKDISFCNQMLSVLNSGCEYAKETYKDNFDPEKGMAKIITIMYQDGAQKVLQDVQAYQRAIQICDLENQNESYKQAWEKLKQATEQQSIQHKTILDRYIIISSRVQADVLKNHFGCPIQIFKDEQKLIKDDTETIAAYLHMNQHVDVQKHTLTIRAASIAQFLRCKCLRAYPLEKK